MSLFRKLFLLILFALAIFKFSATPNIEEEVLFELNCIHSEIEASKEKYIEMGCDLNYSITAFDEKIGELSLSPSFKRKKSLPKKIGVVKEINCQ